MKKGFGSNGALLHRIHGVHMLAIATIALVIVFLALYSFVVAPGIYWPSMQELPSMSVQRESQHGAVATQRKLLAHGLTPANNTEATPDMSSSSVTTQRIGDGCTKDDIVIHQGATAPLPNGIPTYTVQVLNLCTKEADTGCDLSQVHFSCGWFSSARLVNPRVFRRLRYDDCLVNDGRPLPPGSSVSFQYANSFPYQLSVSSASCVSA